MKRTLLALAGGVAVLIAGAYAFVYSGAYNVAATGPHWEIVYRVMETVRVRSIKARAAGIVAPASLDERAALIMGANHFAAHCAVCHGAPGVPKGDIAHGLYPAPPDLRKAAQSYTAAELFWVVKNGLKMTGMPSWKDHGDEELWSTVAFMQRLPAMTEAEYAELVMASMNQGMNHDHSAPAPDHDYAKDRD